MAEKCDYVMIVGDLEVSCSRKGKYKGKCHHHSMVKGFKPLTSQQRRDEILYIKGSRIGIDAMGGIISGTTQIR